MDHQWRPSPTQGNICPVCRISHFPFCPPPPHSFSSNPRFPLTPLHHRPGFDPYNVPPIVPPHTSWRGPNDGLIDKRNRYEPTADPYGLTTPQSHYGPLPSGHGGSNIFLGDGERNYKRMRVGDVSPSGESSAMVERRLKLIRDHGNLIAAGEYNHEIGRLNTDATGVSLPTKGREVIKFEDPGFPKNEVSWSGMSGPNSQYNVGISRNNFGPSLNEQRIYLPYPNEPSSFNAGPSPMSATPPRTPSSLFPVGLSSSRMPPPFPYASHNHSTLSNPHNHHAPNSFSLDSLQPQKPPPQELKVIDASDIFRLPHRARRPDHIVIILRGLPGSGKSYLAKMLRDLEVENGGSAPRIYSMDDYFMTEVEKVEQYDASNSSSGVRAKRSTMKKVMEYCYEPEMEEVYRASMLKAYKKTLEEGAFTFVIVDDRNLRVADFAQFWAIGKKSGYEVYISEATYKDPEGCAARNVHGFSLDDIHQMVKRWEETPALYMQLNVKSLLHGDDLEGSGIQEVDMEMEDEDEEGLPAVECRKPENSLEPSCDEPCGNSEHGNHQEGLVRWVTDAEISTEVVRGLGRSKWSDDLEGQERPDYVNRPLSALSGLAAAYSGKKGKSVRWGDEVGDTGFSIAAAKKSSKSSLVIGPGTGYNLKSNPLGAVEMSGSSSGSVEQRRQNVFQERLRAETESFKVVFDRRRHRIGGFEADEES